MQKPFFAELHGEGEPRLPAERGEQGIRPFLDDDAPDRFYRERFKVDRVRKRLIRHDGGGVGIDQNGAHALGFQYPARLRARIVEFRRLPDDDRPAADNEHALYALVPLRLRYPRRSREACGFPCGKKQIFFKSDARFHGAAADIFNDFARVYAAHGGDFIFFQIRAYILFRAEIRRLRTERLCDVAFERTLFAVAAHAVNADFGKCFHNDFSPALFVRERKGVVRAAARGEFDFPFAFALETEGNPLEHLSVFQNQIRFFHNFTMWRA